MPDPIITPIPPDPNQPVMIDVAAVQTEVKDLLATLVGVTAEGEPSQDTKAIDPQTILVIVQIAQQVMTWFLDRRAKKQPA